MAISVLAVRATNVLLWVRVAPIAVLMVFAWAAPGLRDEWSFLPLAGATCGRLMSRWQGWE